MNSSVTRTQAVQAHERSPEMVVLNRTMERLKPQASSILAQVLRWFSLKRAARAQAHRLQVIDRTVLGEKSYVAVVQVDGRRFMLGGAQSGISLLTELNPAETFAAVLDKAPKSTKPHARRTSKSVSPGDAVRS